MENSSDYNECPATGAEALTACFYRAKQAFRVDGQWNCPHCGEVNGAADDVCGCGFDLENLEEFADKQAFSIAKLVIVLAL